MSQEQKPDVVPTGGRGLALETIIAQWQRERPDIDPSVIAVCGAVWRAGDTLRQGVLQNLSAYELDFAAFDVLLTLRRQGRGQALSPSALAREMMLSTSAMTNRLDRLEKRGLLERGRDPDDRRALQIILTDAGFELADNIVVSHVATEERMLAGLSDAERDQILVLMGKIMGND